MGTWPYLGSAFLQVAVIGYRVDHEWNGHHTHLVDQDLEYRPNVGHDEAGSAVDEAAQQVSPFCSRTAHCWHMALTKQQQTIVVGLA